MVATHGVSPSSRPPAHGPAVRVSTDGAPQVNRPGSRARSGRAASSRSAAARPLKTANAALTRPADVVPVRRKKRRANTLLTKGAGQPRAAFTSLSAEAMNGLQTSGSRHRLA
jgi:hypothetical protein